jgi:peptide/nickel transport system ATP-binding protein
MSDLAELTLAEIAAAIRARKVSSVEVTSTLLARIEAWQPKLNAFVRLEADGALAAAAAADAALARGDAKGALHGVPLAHKDMYYIAGKLAECGSKVRKGFVAPATSTAVARLDQAGTIRLGALHMAEFAYGPTGHNSHLGPARNPWDPTRITGGSSSGSGAAVAARLVYGALGSDTGGSIRLPAHFCGITGLKPTYGRVSRANAMPLSFTLDTVGPLVRSAEDCGLILQEIAGPDPLDPTTANAPAWDASKTRRPVSGITVGIPSAFYTEDLEADVAAAFDEALKTFRGLGVRLVPVTLPDQATVSAAALIVLAAEATSVHAPWLRGPVSRGATLARPGARRLPGGNRPGRRDHHAHVQIAGSHHRGDRHRCRPGRRGGDPGDHPVHAAGQLSGPAVPGGSGRMVSRQTADRRAADRAALRGRDADRPRHGVPGRDRSPPQIAAAPMKPVADPTTDPIVDIRDLRVRFTGERTVHALNGVDVTLHEGEVLGLLGESGSGKSVTLKALLRMLPPRRSTITGSIRVGGKDVMALDEPELEHLRGGVASMIFQEPMLALDPVYTIGDQIAETVVRHEGASWADGRKRALDMLERVRIPSARRRLESYPHEMSGGMRQRAMIALALSCHPRLLLADEPTTALDATVQIQILLLLRELQRELGMAVIFVTHDIGVAVEICDRIAVMYAGRIVETGTTRDVVKSPSHPYTRGLLSSTVLGARRGTPLDAIPGAPPRLDRLPDGCAFAPRCTLAEPICLSGEVANVATAPGRSARCVKLVPA